MLLMKRKYSIILVCLVTVAAAAVATLVQASFFDQLSEKYRGTNSQSQQANIIVEEIKRSQANTTAEPVAEPAEETEIPQAVLLEGGSHAFQTFNNCGPASLSMALSYFGTTISQQELGWELRPYQNPQGNNDDKSVTLTELAAKAEDLGFSTFHYPAGDIETLERLLAAGLPVITRTWLKPGEDIGHYRVIKGYDRSKGIIIQDDSLQGKDISYQYQDFLELWQAFNYEFLVLAKADQVDEVEKILGRHEDKQAWTRALALADEQLIQNPQDVYAQFNKTVAYYYLGQYQQAVAHFERIESKLPPRMLWYQLEPILAYYRLGDYQRVTELVTRILNNHNQAYSELHFLLARIYESTGRTREAQTAFDQAVRYNSSNYWRANLSDI